MSFVQIPSVIDFQIDNIVADFKFPVYKGINEDSGLYVYRLHQKYSTDPEVWIMSDKFAPILKQGNTIYNPVYYAIPENYASVYWTGENYYIYRDGYSDPGAGYGDMVCITKTYPDVYPGYIPYERWLTSGTADDPTPRYEGDRFYVLPDALDDHSRIWEEGTVTFQPRGVYRNEPSLYPAIQMSAQLTGWFSSSLCGVYTPFDSTQQSKVFGLPQWVDSFGNSYIRSLNQDNGYYSYGAIQHFYSSIWMIGSRGNTPWWEGQEPSLESSQMFYEKMYDSSGSIVDTGESSEITFYAYTFGDNTTPIYMNEVAVWK